MTSPPSDNPYITDVDPDFEPVSKIDYADARSQVEQLREAIHYHDTKYYVENDPVIADRTYDALLSRLNGLESAFDLQTQTSPTQRIGGEPVSEFPSVEHTQPLLSIQQSGNEDDVRSFHRTVQEETDGEITYACEPKFDGVSVALYYRDGRLDKAVTRGDGTVGDDITQNVKTINSIPLVLSASPSDIVVRGEIYMPHDAFQAYNKERVEDGDEPFANPRNATAGTIRQQDPTVVAKRPLDFFAFQVLDGDTSWSSRAEAHAALAERGFPVTDLFETVSSIDAAIAYRDRILNQRDELNVPIDGVVIKVNENTQQDTLGRTSSHPRWAFAYKFPPRTGETTIQDIALQVGRTGRITPVALLDPVDVGGVTVSRASLHNPDQIDELGIDIGDTVTVERAGDVIPQVSDVVETQSSSSFTFPSACPVCGNTIQRDGPIARCTGGLSCPAQQRRSIEYYVSRDAMDIDGVGEQVVRDLIDADLVTDVSDLYELTVEDIATLDGYGETSAEKIVHNIQATTEPRLDVFITALGIKEVGPTVARSLAEQFGTFDAFKTASRLSLQQVDDIGSVTANRIREFFTSDTNMDVLDDLLDHVTPQPYTTSTADDFADMTVVFTGSLDGYTRSEATDMVERAGGTVTSSVSGNTDILVVGSNPGQTKREAADTHDVTTVSGDEFVNTLDDLEQSS